MCTLLEIFYDLLQETEDSALKLCCICVWIDLVNVYAKLLVFIARVFNLIHYILIHLELLLYLCNCWFYVCFDSVVCKSCLLSIFFHAFLCWLCSENVRRFSVVRSLCWRHSVVCYSSRIILTQPKVCCLAINVNFLHSSSHNGETTVAFWSHCTLALSLCRCEKLWFSCFMADPNNVLLVIKD